MTEDLSTQKSSEYSPKGWIKDLDALGRNTWSLECHHGEALITDLATLVESLKKGAHYEVYVTPRGKEKLHALKWDLKDAEHWALNELGFLTEAETYKWKKMRETLESLNAE